MLRAPWNPLNGVFKGISFPIGQRRGKFPASEQAAFID
jgi:hypothetical protein